VAADLVGDTTVVPVGVGFVAGAVAAAAAAAEWVGVSTTSGAGRGAPGNTGRSGTGGRGVAWFPLPLPKMESIDTVLMWRDGAVDDGTATETLSRALSADDGRRESPPPLPLDAMLACGESIGGTVSPSAADGRLDSGGGPGSS
jgi:hypothetical protein